MSYTPQSWTDGSGGGTPLSAARLNYIESGIQAAASTADTALSSASGVPAVVQVDSFSGTDAQKMSAALTYAAAQTNVPWLQLPARTFDTGTTSYDWFFGMKICGAGYESAPKNMELGNGSPLGIWRTSCGTGANSLLRASTTVQSVALSNIQFYAPGNGSQIMRASGGAGLYPSVFHNLSLYGGPYFFGNPTEKFLTTQMVFSGHWTVLGYNNTPFTMGGGDCSLWVGGYLNSNSSGTGGGKPIVDLQGMGKTNIGLMYLTNEGDWVGLRVSGGSDKHISIFGGMFEGRSQTTLATRPVIDIQGGTVNLYGPWLGQVSSSSGTANGVITQSGGTLKLYGGTYYRGAATTAAFPLIYQTGGKTEFHGVPECVVSGEQVRFRRSDGVTKVMPLTMNGPDDAPAAATDATTTQALANSLRQALIDAGILA